MLALTVSGLAAAAAVPAGSAGPTPALLAEYLTRDIGLEPGELGTIERGEPVARSLDTNDANEVAIVAVIKVDIPKEQYQTGRRVRYWASSSTRGGANFLDIQNICSIIKA